MKEARRKTKRIVGGKTVSPAIAGRLLKLLNEEARKRKKYSLVGRKRNLFRERILHQDCNPNVRLCFSVPAVMFEHFRNGREKEN